MQEGAIGCPSSYTPKLYFRFKSGREEAAQNIPDNRNNLAEHRHEFF